MGAAQTAQGLGATSDAARTAAQTAAAGGLGAYERAIGGVDDIAQAARNVAGQARTGGQTAAQQAAQQTQAAISGARGITGDAAQALQAAGALGTQTAQQGIAGLAGTTGGFDPASSGAFMNQFEDAAVQQALQDIQRAGQIQERSSTAQAVKRRSVWRIKTSCSRTRIRQKYLRTTGQNCRRYASARLRKRGSTGSTGI